jgi:biotin operon repressor
LEARGFLRVKRIHRRVEYHISAPSDAGSLAELIAALRISLRGQPLPVARITRSATAFTHPARVQIYRALQSGPKTESQIQAAIQLSSMAIWRHMRKLVARGFVTFDDTRRVYAPCENPDRIGRALGKLAAS